MPTSDILKQVWYQAVDNNTGVVLRCENTCTCFELTLYGCVINLLLPVQNCGINKESNLWSTNVW